MSLEGKINDLFAYAMKGQWTEVLQVYEKSPEAQKAKITKSEDTALHIAVSGGKTDIALELVGISQNGILEIENARGNTALHIAASLGDLSVCSGMVSKNPKLIHIRNINGETPLFLAALHGKRDTFHYLHSLNNDEYLLRRNNGDTILHATISGEYFSLAVSIIHCHPGLADSINENGLSPLHILASLVVDELKEKSLDVEAYIEKKNKKGKEILKYPTNYKTCISFFVLLTSVFQVLFNKLITNAWTLSLRGLHRSLSQVLKGRKESGKPADEESPQPKSNSVQAKGKEEQENKIVEDVQKTCLSQGIDQFESQRSEDRRFPPIYDKVILFLNLVIKALLIILGIGIWRIDKIQRKKELHMWANRALDELVKHTTSYQFYDNTGCDPQQTQEEEGEEEFGDLNDQNYMSDKVKNLNRSSCFKYDKKRSDQIEIGKQHTPILIAAKMGVTEMVEKVLDKFPVAIQDLDSDNKNVVLLAAEHRQPQVYNLLLNKTIIKESVFRQLDNDGNSALHLAARCKQQRPWLISGVAFQMQWEIKWYKFVKNSMPPQFFPRYNMRHETPKEVFITTHKELTKEGSKWLIKTSDSCALVATLIATVAFTTSATIPGGPNQETGEPILEGKPVFEAFAITSLLALCFSITALVFFLAILTSRYDEKDFAVDLPRKLLLGMTSLFASIASILVSFCDGHFYILSPKLRHITIPIYATLLIPVTYFALAQVPLYFDLLSAIIRKVPQRSKKAFLH